tara:strand:+ start:1147 stop:1410 length:264 start_codon:yes stop_codon:yes gene_type:complete
MSLDETRESTQSQTLVGISEEDALTQRLVGRPSLQQFCEEAVRTNYQPTFCGHRRPVEKRALADAFDAKMEELGSDIRAHRCHFGPS